LGETKRLFSWSKNFPSCLLPPALEPSASPEGLLNDYKIGRVMDKLYEYGLSKLFLLIALSAAKKYNVNMELNSSRY